MKMDWPRGFRLWELHTRPHWERERSLTVSEVRGRGDWWRAELRVFFLVSLQPRGPVPTRLPALEVELLDTTCLPLIASFVP